jgi:hypothetical protein
LAGPHPSPVAIVRACLMQASACAARLAEVSILDHIVAAERVPTGVAAGTMMKGFAATDGFLHGDRACPVRRSLEVSMSPLDGYLLNAAVNGFSGRTDENVSQGESLRGRDETANGLSGSL